MSFDKANQQEPERKEAQRKFGSIKALKPLKDDVWVETLIQSCCGLNTPDAVSFRAAEIARVRGIGPLHTLITLEKGDEFVIALPHATVAEKIYDAEAGLLDLKPYAYPHSKEDLRNQLRVAFQAAQEKKKYEDYERLTYRAWVRLSQTENFKEADISGADIDFSKMSEGGSKIGGACVTFTTHLPNGSPFGTESFIIETTLSDFGRMVKEAAQRGDTMLDIRKYSLRKGTTFSKKDPAP